MTPLTPLTVEERREWERFCEPFPCKCGHSKGHHQMRIGQRGNYTPCNLCRDCDGFTRISNADYRVVAEDFLPKALAEIDRVAAERDAALAQVREAEGRSAWQPIETAPKDGTEVLGWFPYHSSPEVGGSTFVMRWNDESHCRKPAPFWEASGWVWGTRDQRKKQPTFWQPLPPPPSTREERE